MNKEKKVTPYSLIGAVCCIICACTYVVFGYGDFVYIWKSVVLLMVAILLLIRKKTIIWIFPFAVQIWIWKIENLELHDTFYSVAEVCLLLAYVTMLLILSCNTISALKKVAMKANKFVWFIPAVLMFVGCGVMEGRFQTLRYIRFEHGYFFSTIGFLFSTYRFLIEALILLCIGIWIKTIYQEPKNQKVEHNYTKLETMILNEAYCDMAKHILLLLFTLGIWYFIWIHRMTKYTNAVENEEYRDPTKKLLLCLFVPFYTIYWTYKTAQRVDKMAAVKGISSDMVTLCLILAIIVPIIPPILLQDKMNNIATINDMKSSSALKVENKNTTTLETVEELKKFKELLDSGVITQEEFEVKKKQLLGL